MVTKSSHIHVCAFAQTQTDISSIVCASVGVHVFLHVCPQVGFICLCMCLQAQMCMSPLARLFCPPVVPVEWSGGDISPKHVLRVAEAWGQGSGWVNPAVTHGASVTPVDSTQERGASAAGG